MLPLHPAFVWIINPRVLGLSFAALTIGSMVPDIEPAISYLAGASVFCGVSVECKAAPDRLVLHSIVGAVTVDVGLTFLFCLLIARLFKPEKFGLKGFSKISMNWTFYISAAIGSLIHVFVDWLHHPANPIFWPLLVGNPPSYYVPGLLLPYMNVFSASFIVAIIGACLMIIVATRALTRSKYTFSELASNPVLVISLLTESLEGTSRSSSSR